MRAVIFANGKLNDPGIVISLLQADDLIIAADGGALHCQTLGIHPAVVIGDMDSIPGELLEDLKCNHSDLVVYPADKDQTDLELALKYTLDNGAQEVLLFGVLGGRLDMTLANLLLLTREEWNSLSIKVIDGPQTAYLLRSGDSMKVKGNQGDTISLIPLSERVKNVITQGLRWQLDGVELVQGTTLSVSNQLRSTSAQVQIAAGKLLLIHCRENAGCGEE